MSRMSPGIFRLVALFGVVALTATFGATTSAHGGHGKPALIQTGTCDALGGAVFTLIGVGAEEDAEGLPIASPAAVGPETAAALTTSTSTVEATVETIVGGGHSIVVYASDEEMDSPIACGAVGGIQLGDDLIVGLNPVGDEGMSGIALLRNSGTQSTITIVLNESISHAAEEAGQSHEEEEHGHDEGAATPEA